MPATPRPSRARAQHPGIGAAHPDKILLADAQLVIAREHGFASWPRLVHYVDDLERQQHALTQLHGGPGLYEAHARSLLADHHARCTWAGRALAAYVPRFNELRGDEALASAVTGKSALIPVANRGVDVRWPPVGSVKRLHCASTYSADASIHNAGRRLADNRRRTKDDEREKAPIRAEYMHAAVVHSVIILANGSSALTRAIMTDDACVTR